MKKDKLIILLGVLTLVIVIVAILLFRANNTMRNKVKIIDASYMCQENLEKFYEDDKYIYSFPCVKSSMVFVELADGRKMLVVKALEDGLVTIDELINAGLDVVKTEK